MFNIVNKIKDLFIFSDVTVKVTPSKGEPVVIHAKTKVTPKKTYEEYEDMYDCPRKENMKKAAMEKYGSLHDSYKSYMQYKKADRIYKLGHRNKGAIRNRKKYLRDTDTNVYWNPKSRRFY